MVQIHPFENGNGRFARLVADRYLLCYQCLHPFWPENLNYEGLERKSYIKSLKDADEGNYELLVALMKKWGAKDPSLIELLEESYYKPLFESEAGLAKVQALLRNGEDPNIVSKKGHSILHLVIKAKIQKQRKIELLNLVIKRGANIYAIDKNGLTPFQLAIKNNDKEIANNLI